MLSVRVAAMAVLQGIHLRREGWVTRRRKLLCGRARLKYAYFHTAAAQ
jgi:hypothetical protein